MSEGIAIAVRIKSTVMETVNSTMLKPAMRLRRVRGFGALFCKVGFLIALTGWIAGPAFERGNYIAKEFAKPPHSSQSHGWFQHGRIDRFHDRALDSDGDCDPFAHALVSNLPAQRRGRAPV